MWYYIPINPDPWAIGPLQIGKRNGKMFPQVGRNQQLAAFKEAVKEELLSQGAELLPSGLYEVEFYFWRRLDSGAGTRKHVADATNLQKATEDALQNVLIDNDRNVARVRSTIVEQSEELSVEPCIAIRVMLYEGFDPAEIPQEIWDKIDNTEGPILFDNTWGGPGS